MVNFGNEFLSGNPQVELYRLCWDKSNREPFVEQLNKLFLDARADKSLEFNVDERLRAPGDKTNSYTALMMVHLTKHFFKLNQKFSIFEKCFVKVMRKSQARRSGILTSSRCFSHSHHE